MLFNSVEFLVFFLPIVLIVYSVLSKMGYYRVVIFWLVGVSFFFYGWWNPVYLILILISIFFNYTIGRAIYRDGTVNSKLILIFGVTVNLTGLFYFKYANFIIDNYNAVTNSNYHLQKIILPLAISFFTFQQIAYLVDAYNGKFQKYKFSHYCLFVTFFPQLIAGPIVQHKEMFPQFKKIGVSKHNPDNISIGLAIFLLGLFKKVVMADGLSVYVSPVFLGAEQGAAITFFEGWSGALAYTFQLYFDFSGYSDMAIGIAKTVNINLPLNFYSPYKAANIIDFWRRWHITLSRFLRDYLYIPLGGSRTSGQRRYVNLMVTMLLGGLWHGANWTFVVWGGLHGFYLVINHLWRNLKKSFGADWSYSGPFDLWSGRIITFSSVVVAWVVFRAETFSGAINIFKGMAGLNGFVLPTQIASVIPGIKNYITTVGTMPLLGGGTMMGVFEMMGMLLLSMMLICSPALHEMNFRPRLIALTASMYFTIQMIFFSRAPSEFLYFQF